MCKILILLCTSQGRHIRAVARLRPLFKHSKKKKMVGTARFELATSRTPSVRATRLRYVPTEAAISRRERLKPQVWGRCVMLELKLRPFYLEETAPTSRLSPPFEKRQESVQRVAQIEQHPAAEQLRS